MCSNPFHLIKGAIADTHILIRMPNLLARFKRGLSNAQGPVESPVVIGIPSPLPVAVELGRKIHPNLQDLIPPFISPPPPSPTAASSSVPINDGDDSGDGILPLKPRPRGRSAQPPSAHHPTSFTGNPDAHPHEVPLPPSRSISTTSSYEHHDSLMQTPPPPASSQSPAPPSSWATFGRKVMRGAKSIPNIIDASRPSTAGSRTTSQRSHTHTPASTTDGMPDPFTPFASVSSGSAPSSGFTFGHGHMSSMVAPPMPALNHPAFQETSSPVTEGLPVSLTDDREVVQLFSEKQAVHPQPRPSISLPSIPSRSRMSLGPRPRLQDIFASTSQSIESSSRSRQQSTLSCGSGSRRKRARRSKSASVLSQHACVVDAPLTDGGARERSKFTYLDTGQARGNSVGAFSFFRRSSCLISSLSFYWALFSFVPVAGLRGVWSGITILITQCIRYVGLFLSSYRWRY